MKTLSILMAQVIILLLIGINTALAQFSVGLQGGVAKSDADNSKTASGGGINLRVFASPHLALGVAGKLYADRMTSLAGGQEFKVTGAMMPLTGTIDYFLTTGGIRPYIGGDAGAYFSKYEVELNGKNVSTDRRRTNFGAAPRAGILFAFGNFGIQVEGIYHFIFGNNDHSYAIGSLDNINFQSSTKAYGVNVGLIFGLGKNQFKN